MRPPAVSVLGCGIDPMRQEDVLGWCLETARSSPRARILLTANASHLVAMQDDPALRAAARAAEEAVGEATAFRRADARFHVLVAELGRSARLVAAEAQLQVELGEVLALTPGPARARRVSQAGHDPIVAAIAAEDPDAARAATIRHVEATHDWVRGLARGLRRRGS